VSRQLRCYQGLGDQVMGRNSETADWRGEATLREAWQETCQGGLHLLTKTGNDPVIIKLRA